MPLSNFFHINLPYGIAKNSLNEWYAFNRDYMPIGYSSRNHKRDAGNDRYIDLPVYTSYNGLTESFAMKVAYNEKGIERNHAGEITTIYLYSGTTPQPNSEEFTDYFERIKLLSQLKVKALSSI